MLLWKEHWLWGPSLSEPQNCCILGGCCGQTVSPVWTGSWSYKIQTDIHACCPSHLMMGCYVNITRTCFLLSFPVWSDSTQEETRETWVTTSQKSLVPPWLQPSIVNKQKLSCPSLVLSWKDGRGRILKIVRSNYCCLAERGIHYGAVQPLRYLYHRQSFISLPSSYQSHMAAEHGLCFSPTDAWAVNGVALFWSLGSAFLPGYQSKTTFIQKTQGKGLVARTRGAPPPPSSPLPSVWESFHFIVPLRVVSSFKWTSMNDEIKYFAQMALHLNKRKPLRLVQNRVFYLCF